MSDPTSCLAPSPMSEGIAATSVREFLTFKLGEEEYGMDILRVQEIRSYEPPTRMANTADFIKGVVNLRGVIVPIVDMRIKFNLPQVRYDGFTAVIVLNIGTLVVGIVVDGVSDVVSLTANQLRPLPKISSAVNMDYMLAIGAVGARTLILIDIGKLLRSAEMGLTQVNKE